jgi:hypothetical protein
MFSIFLVAQGGFAFFLTPAAAGFRSCVAGARLFAALETKPFLLSCFAMAGFRTFVLVIPCPEGELYTAELRMSNAARRRGPADFLSTSPGPSCWRPSLSQHVSLDGLACHRGAAQGFTRADD